LSAAVETEISDALAIEARGLSKSFEKTILSDLSLSVGVGEFVAIVGPSGCGKSTLLNIIAGLVEPDAGAVRLGFGGFDALIGNVGYMQQRDALLPWRTVLANARLGLELRGVARREADELVRSHLATFGLNADILNKRPWQLSGGMRQRVALLRSILSSRGALLLDEPFSALDAITRQDLQRWLADFLRRERMTVILVTHDVNEALMLSDRLLVMSSPPARFIAEYELERDGANGASADIVKRARLKSEIEAALAQGRRN